MVGPFELHTPAQRAEAMALFRSAFAALAPGPPNADRGTAFISCRFLVAAIRMIYSTYGSAADARWYGMVDDGTLVSAALVTNADARLTFRSYLELARFGVEFVAMLGWAGMRQLVREVKAWPAGQGQAAAAAFLPQPGFQELQLIATSPAVQGRGHGDRLLTFLKADAAARGYAGLSLTTVGQSPAHRWYLRHGFVCEVEVSVLHTAVCRMMLSLREGHLRTEGDAPGRL